MTEWIEDSVLNLQAQGILRVEDGNHGEYRPRSDEFCEEGVAFIRAADMADGAIDFIAASKINDTATARITKGIGRPGDVLISHKGTVGKIARAPASAPPFVCSPQTTFWRSTNEDVLRQDFLYVLIRSPAFMREFLVSSGETDMAGYVSLTSQRRLRLSLPPIALQRSISECISAFDQKIELNRKMNETLEAMARALFRDWFVDFGPTRTKMEGRTPYLSPDIWALFPDRLDDEGKPERWAYEPLLDQAEWVNGAAYKNMHFSDTPEALPVIKIAELKNGVTATTQRTATDLGARYLIDDGELLFSWSGNPDTSIDTFLWTGGKAWLNQHIFAVRQNSARSKPFLHTLLKFLKPEFAELARNKQTTGLGHVTKADMQRMLVCAASSEVHQAFDRLIEPIFNQALGLQKETHTLAQTRDLLLPRLMSGELRITQAERTLEEVL